jgi:hypothetical protein
MKPKFMLTAEFCIQQPADAEMGLTMDEARAFLTRSDDECTAAGLPSSWIDLALVHFKQ